MELVSSQPFDDFPKAYAPRGVEDKYGLSHLIGICSEPRYLSAAFTAFLYANEN